MLKALSLLVIEHIRQRPVRVCLTFLGVAIGVSAWMAIRLANVEVLRTFEESVTEVVGNATIQVLSEEGGIDERIITQLRMHPAVESANPVLRISSTVINENHRGKSIEIWSVDLIEYGRGGNALISFNQAGTEDRLQALLARNSAFVGKHVASTLGLEIGDHLDIRVEGIQHRIVIQGFLTSSSPPNGTVDNLLIMDIAAAQDLFGLTGQLNQIDLVTTTGFPIPQVIEELESLFSPPLEIHRSPRRSQRVESMISAFQFNLTMLSGVGLLVGMFLAYNAAFFSVVQHRQEIGILRAIGMSQFQISTIFVCEAALVGLVGGLAGCAFGLILAQFLLSLVSQNVSDLYAAVSVGTVRMSSHMLLEGGVIGFAVSVLGALRPCIEAGHIAPVRVLTPGGHEIATIEQVAGLTWMGVASFILAAVLSFFEPINGIPIFGYMATFFLLLGCTLWGPLCLRTFGWIMQKRTGRMVGSLGTLAVEQVTRTPGRNGVTLSALVIGLAIMVGVGIMVRSFRGTVEMWVDQTILADLIVAPSSWLDNGESHGADSGLPIELAKNLEAIVGIAAVDPYRQIQVDAQDNEIMLVARDINLHAKRSRYVFENGESEAILQQTIQQKGIIVSEVLSQRLGLVVGERLSLSTPSGPQSFPILGTFYDYATDGGKAVLDKEVYHQYWNDPKATVFAVYLDSEADIHEVRRRIENTNVQPNPIVTISHKELRSEILAIFDRTFHVTYVLEFIALSVALLGIMNTLITAILERQREIATLRAIGASQRQIQGMVFWESGYLTFLGTILGLMGGVALAVLLVKVINKQSFGWTVQLMFPGITIVEAVFVAGIAGIVAGFIPARWASQQSIAQGLRYE